MQQQITDTISYSETDQSKERETCSVVGLDGYCKATQSYKMILCLQIRFCKSDY